ncbi:hypothetical protein BKA69DRAFT_19463 [Paraphysoderma sedebokerense]|nr:hypothetical protein BKA69DRAFT_19463 [Paraphysoderma sedebokerense]
MSYQSPQVVDQKKEDFRKYLEKNGIIDSLTKILVSLYEEPEKPENPIDFIKLFLSGPSDVDVDVLKSENDTLKAENNELKAKVDDLMKKVKELGGTVDISPQTR